jgi:hypothetical protein
MAMATTGARTAFARKLTDLASGSPFTASTAPVDRTGPESGNRAASILLNGRLHQHASFPSALINWRAFFSARAIGITRLLPQSGAVSTLNCVTARFLTGNHVTPESIRRIPRTNPWPRAAQAWGLVRGGLTDFEKV